MDGIPGPTSGRLREILDVAAGIFREKGYYATSTEEIARAVGLLKGSLYHYIDSKEDLLFHVVSAAHHRLVDGVEEEISQAPDPLARLRSLLERHFVRAAEDLTGTAVCYQDFRSLGPERRALIIAVRDGYEALVCGLIVEGQEQGVVCPDLSPQVSAAGVLTGLNAIHLWYRPDAGRSPEEMARLHVDFLLASLACTPDAHASGHRRRLGEADVDLTLVALDREEVP